MSGGTRVKRFVEGQDRAQLMLLPECLDDFVGEDNPVRVVDAFIEELDLAVLGFAGVVPEVTGRPAYHPSTLLKIYLYGYLNCVQSSRRHGGRLTSQIAFEALPQKCRVTLIDLFEPSHSSNGVGKPLGRDWRRKQNVLRVSCTHKGPLDNDSYELILDQQVGGGLPPGNQH